MELPKGVNDSLKKVREFAEKVTIGHPSVEANPAFSLFARGDFDEKKIEFIRGVLESDSYGVRFEDVALQLSAGKLLVPRISEFAAIQLAQKIFDIVNDLEVGLADEIMPSADESEIGSELIDPARYRQHEEEARDLAEEPDSEEDVFTSSVNDLAGYQITRILSAITLSDIIPAEIAENPDSKEFEERSDKLIHALASRAFKLGAHGVIGIGFSVKLIEGYRDKNGEPARAYRMLASGTAVRAKKVDATGE